MEERHTAVRHTATETQIYEDIRQALEEKKSAVRHTATETQILEDIGEALDETNRSKAYYCDRDTVDLDERHAIRRSVLRQRQGNFEYVREALDERHTPVKHTETGTQ